VSHKLREEQQDGAAQISDRVGQGIQKLSNYLEERDTGELIDDANAFARNHPGAFLGGAALLGFSIARFLRSAPNRQEFAGHSFLEPGDIE
jgi:hypothetical protein